MPEREYKKENDSTAASNNFIDSWDKRLARNLSLLCDGAIIGFGIATVASFFLNGQYTTSLGGMTAIVGVVDWALSCYGNR